MYPRVTQAIASAAFAALALLPPIDAAFADVLIGQTAGFSGPQASSVKEVTDGARLWIDYVNAKGGNHGQPIWIESLDDKFDPKQAGENARTLIEEKNVVAMFLTRGTPHTEAVIPWLDKHGVPLVGPSTGAMLLHKPPKKHVFNVRSTYQSEAEKAVAQMLALGVRRMAVVHVDDSFGADAAIGALKGIDAAGLKPILVEKFDRAKPDFSAIVLRIVNGNADGVILIGSGAVAADGIKAMREAGTMAQIITLSNNASGGFIKLLGAHARGVVVSQVFPDERSLNLPMIREAQKLAKEKGINELTPAMVEGYAAAKVLTEALRRAGPKPTRASMLAALDGLRNFDLGGLSISYSPEDHTGLDFVDLSIIGQDGRFWR
jgi:ABC-type branched-subunit amino acid transport system substrate-binding protein